MTANELADWIENGAPFGDYETAKQATTMLRKQQAEIEMLKKEIEDDEWTKYKLILKAKKAIMHDINNELIEIIKKASDR